MNVSESYANYQWDISNTGTESDIAKYEYGDASPDSSRAADKNHFVQKSIVLRAPRRSSMKQKGLPRRASIQFSGEIEVNIPGAERPIKRRTSITFRDSVNVRNVPPAQNLTDEPESLWFQEDEYIEMKQKIRSLLEKVQRNGSKKVANGKGHYCTRGLERFFMQDVVQNRRYKALDSVLDVQTLQRLEGNYDADFIANLCIFESAQCRKEAAKRGDKDAREAAKQYSSTMMGGRLRRYPVSSPNFSMARRA